MVVILQVIQQVYILCVKMKLKIIIPILLFIFLISNVNASYFNLDDVKLISNTSVLPTSPHDIIFNNDGTKIYIPDSTGGNKVHIFNLTTSFDSTTATYDSYVLFSDSCSYDSKFCNPTGITFNNDGTKIYMSSFNSDYIAQFSLSPAFNISSFTLEEWINVSGNDELISDLTFNDDGSKLYYSTETNDIIYQMNLSENFNISTAIYDSNMTFSGFYEFTDLKFNNDGSKLFLLNLFSEQIYEFNLSTNYEISTGLLNNYVSVPDDYPTGITFNNDGSKLYSVTYQNDLVFEYSLLNSCPQTWNGTHVNNSNIQSTECYQESTSNASVCNALNDTYNIPPQWINGSYAFDNDWLTFATYKTDLSGVITHVNYFKPNNSFNASLQFKINSSTNRTISIPDSCFNCNDEYITMLYFIYYDTYDDTQIKIECTTTSGYIEIFPFTTGDGIYEEGITWNIYDELNIYAEDECTLYTGLPNYNSINLIGTSGDLTINGNIYTNELNIETTTSGILEILIDSILGVLT
jgi:DNA-binding beta-propeller fold protein YncE